MNIVSKSISTAFLLLVAGTSLAQDNFDLLKRSDALAVQEAPPLRAVYESANEAFEAGDYAEAFRDYDYAAWQGSIAAASRLCVLEAYGIGTQVNHLKAAFWCDRAAAAGHELAQVQSYLSDYRTVGY